MKISKSNTVLFVMLAFTILLTSCSAKYASKNEVIKYAESCAKGEKITIDEEVEKHRYSFHSEDRDLSFEVWSTADTIDIDGTNFGYTGDYTLGSDYSEKVNEYYETRVYELLKSHGFTDYEKSKKYTSLKNFSICVTDMHTNADIQELNSFLGELQDIANEESEFHDEDFFKDNAMYNYELAWQWGGYYIRTIGTNRHDYSSDIFPGNDKFNVKDLQETNQNMANVTPPNYDGILLYVPPRSDKDKNK